MDKITIVTTTWWPKGGEERARVAVEASVSWLSYLRYEGDLAIHVADDGSELPLNFEKWSQTLMRMRDGLSVSMTRQERKGIGASLNTGFKKAFESSPLAMYLTDDWVLRGPIDLTPWAQLLLDDESIGMIRLGPPHPGLTGRVEATEHGWIIRFNRHNIVDSQRPALYHRRFFESYGWYKEGINCWESERIHNLNFCESEGPDIVYAIIHPWEHVVTVELGRLEPC